jgi:DMSO/TMAO reductase YedYZ molybdopterin-dependent catalytic subunit
MRVMRSRPDSTGPQTLHTRRLFLRQGLAFAAVGGLSSPGWAAAQTPAATPAQTPTPAQVPTPAPTLTQPFDNGVRELIAYPGKRPLLRITTRPPHLETPFAMFNEGVITPNDAFFVRYHLANIPLSIDPAAFRLKVRGKVDKELSLSIADLQSMGPPAEVVAVNQCSGNSRGFSTPRVFGAQLGNGSMGNARWTGIPLHTVLRRAGLVAGAKQVTFNGLDTPVLPATPDFIKALDVDVALGADVLLAWSMNGEDIPLLNGYPLKLVVPGYFGTYWVKHLSEITVLDQPFTGHDAWFMTTGYRLPDNDCNCVAPGTAPEKTTPISRLRVRSFITSLADDAVVTLGHRIVVKGIAFDGGAGIKKVELSADGGNRWQDAALGNDLGRYSFREWSVPFVPSRRGPLSLQVRATTRSGETQPAQSSWNPAGYARNGIESVHVVVA